MQQIRNAILAATVIFAAVRAAAVEPVDSTATALATIWGLHINSTPDRPTDTEAYLNGIAEAFRQTANDDARLRGIAEGMAMARQLQQIEQSSGLKIDRTAFLAALNDAATGKPTGFTSGTAEAYLNRAAEQASRTAAEQTRKKSAEFLAQQAKRQNVTVTPSGLLFEVITDGEGVPPSADDTVDIYYTGSLPDGTVFDSTTEGRPASMRVSQTVKGFSEGLQMMKPGGHYRLYIPADLAYGEHGAGGVVPPGSAIAFDIELLNVKQ